MEPLYARLRAYAGPDAGLAPRAAAFLFNLAAPAVDWFLTRWVRAVVRSAPSLVVTVAFDDGESRTFWKADPDDVREYLDRADGRAVTLDVQRPDTD